MVISFNLGYSLKDLPTRDEVNKKFEQMDVTVNQINNKLDKFLYIVLGYMFSLVAGTVFLLIRFGNFGG